jgi:hypothetical protein
MSIEVYEIEFAFDQRQQLWFWRLSGPGQRTIAVAGEGYTTLEACQEVAWKLFPPADVVEEMRAASENAEDNGGRSTAE